MKTDLERAEFLVLLEKLQSEDDSIISATVSEINSKMIVAEVSWDDLLISQDDTQVDDEADMANQKADAENASVDIFEPLNDEEKREAEDLIDAIRSMKVSGSTKQELDEYANDINEGEFELTDLRYLRALKKRLSD
jgi:hypothetical protein